MSKNYIYLAFCLFDRVGVKVLSIAILTLFSVSGLRAQVAIGSDIAPEKGVLLELKKQLADLTSNVTATKGMIFRA